MLVSDTGKTTCAALEVTAFALFAFALEAALDAATLDAAEEKMSDTVLETTPEEVEFPLELGEMLEWELPLCPIVFFVCAVQPMDEINNKSVSKNKNHFFILFSPVLFYKKI